jgi:hypothetical protein
MGALMVRPVTHGLGAGPLDTFIDLGVPLVVLIFMWLCSRRGRRRREEAERRRAAGDRTYYTALGTADLATLVGMLDARSDRTPEDDRLLVDARAELDRRRTTRREHPKN